MTPSDRLDMRVEGEGGGDDPGLPVRAALPLRWGDGGRASLHLADVCRIEIKWGGGGGRNAQVGATAAVCPDACGCCRQV